MTVQINYGDVESSDSLSQYTNDKLTSALSAYQDRVTRVEVHLRDDKQGRTGPDDLRCMMEVRLAGDNPFSVEARGEDMYVVVNDAAGKLKRAVAKHVGRK